MIRTSTSTPGTPVSRVLTRSSLARGVALLVSRDRHLAAIVRRHGPPPLGARRPGFATLVRIILEQQVSLASGRASYERLRRHVGRVAPREVARATPAGLRSVGLTIQKAGYCHGLAVRILDRRLDLSVVARSPDEEGQRLLLEVPGIGPWSVAVYYLMALRRPDVWPDGDLALAEALREVKRLPARPTGEEQQRLVASWRPWRSVAARILWHHYLSTPRIRSR